MAQKLNPEQLEEAVSNVVKASHTEPIERFQSLARNVLASETEASILDQIVDNCVKAERGYNTLLDGKKSTIATMRGIRELAENLARVELDEVKGGEYAYQAPKVEGGL